MVKNTAIVAGLLATLLLGVPSVPVVSADLAIAGGLPAWRAEHPDTVQALILLTHLGGAALLLSLTGIAFLALLRRRVADAVLLAAVVLGGRLMIEVMKFLFDRARPAFDLHPVTVYSQSFPSGHAGNSTITYLTVALIALPSRWRRAGVAAAILLSLAIGATRPLLGVHWPSDVLGGWLFGLAWVGACMAIAGRFTSSGTATSDCSPALPADR